MKNKILTFDSSKAKDYFLKEISFKTSPNELHENIKSDIKDINIIDVRAYDDYIDGHIPFAIHIPIDSLEEHLVMLEKDKVNVVYTYCSLCKRADKAAYVIAEHGYPVTVLMGGFKAWQKMEYDIVKTSAE